MTVSAGIDLGTTNSVLAVLQNDRPVVVPDQEGRAVTPSVVSIRPDGVLVGRAAKACLLAEPTNTFASIKRKMGQRWSRAVNRTVYTPEQISAMILGHLKRYGEAHLGESITEAVVTVPAHFNSIQRQATRDAGEIAGLKVLRIINEPTAAALAYGHEHQMSSVLVVFDLGGGTFDISVVEAGDGLYEVLHSAGDNHLGGDDFNLRIVRWIVQEFQAQSSIDVRRDAVAMSRIHGAAVEAKHALTDAKETEVRIDNLSGGKNFEAALTRGAFEAMCRDLFDRLRTIAGGVCRHFTQDRYHREYPGIFDNEMSGCDILLVGGETRVPAVRQVVWEVFKGRIHTDVNPDEVVALGAALQAGIIQRRPELKELLLVDSTALSLGTAIHGEIFSRIIDAGTRIPCSKTHVYSPVADFTEAILFGVYQGESDLVANNIKLGEFEFPIVPPRPRHLVSFGLTFELDANDILHVKAVDRATGNSQQITIRDSQNLDRGTVERLKREAAESRGADERELARLRRRHQIEEFLRLVEMQIPDLTRRRPLDPLLAEILLKISNLRKALESEDDAAFEDAAEELEEAWRLAGQEVPEPPPQLESEANEVEYEIPEPPPIPAASDMTNCGHCGAALPKGFAFCGKCGMPLKKDTCPKCGAALMEGFSFCGKCGTKVE